MDRSAVLDDTGLPREVADLVLDEAGSEMQLILRDLGSGKASAVKNEDLGLLKLAATSVAGLIAATTISGWAPGAIASLIVLLYELRKKRVDLSPLQAAILRELKTHPGLTSVEIAKGLRMKGVDSVAVHTELNKMTAIPRHDGVKVALVSQEDKGRWRTQDV